MMDPLDNVGDIGARPVRGVRLHLAAGIVPAVPAFCGGFVASTAPRLIAESVRAIS
jgi:hypothetical protein